MRAMILAAGLGKRMGELTAHTPKPLVKVADRYLIEYALANLKRANILEVVINVAYLGEQVMQALGDGSRYGMHIQYSIEEERLETGGGIVKALPLLGSDPFLVISSDIICDFPLQNLPTHLNALAHLVLVDNPLFHPFGDFGLNADKITLENKPYFTFANIGIYHPDLFKNETESHFPLNRLLFPAIENNQVTGEYYQGLWFNIGSPQELASAESYFKSSATLLKHT